MLSRWRCFRSGLWVHVYQRRKRTFFFPPSANSSYRLSGGFSSSGIINRQGAITARWRKRNLGSSFPNRGLVATASGEGGQDIHYQNWCSQPPIRGFRKCFRALEGSYFTGFCLVSLQINVAVWGSDWVHAHRCASTKILTRSVSASAWKPRQVPRTMLKLLQFHQNCRISHTTSYRWRSSDWRYRFNLGRSASWFLAGQASYFTRMTKQSGAYVGWGKKKFNKMQNMCSWGNK